MINKNIFKYEGIKKICLFLAALTLIQALTIVSMARYLAQAIANLFHGAPISSISLEIGLFSAAYFSRYFLNTLKKDMVYRYAAKTAKNKREQLLRSLFILGPRFRDKEGTGKIVTTVMEGIPDFQHYLELFLPKFMNMLFIPTVIWGYVCYEDRTSAIVLLLTLPILIIFLMILGLAAKKQADSQFETYRMLSNHFIDSLKGLETLKYLGLSKEHEKKISKVSTNYRKATMKTLRVAFMSSFALDFFTMLSIAVVALYLGLGLIDGAILLGPALTVLILAPEYFLPVRELGADYHATLDGQEAGRTVQQIIDLANEQKQHQIYQQLPVYTEESTLEVKNITLQFQKDLQPSLKNNSFCINGFQKVGVIGASGAGKSTLIDVLSGFLSPTSGTIQMNDMEMPSLMNEFWQNQVTYIPQHPFIFHDSIAANISFYEPEVSLEKIEKAATMAGISSFINELPDKYETIIGEAGRMISGGQEQRIALARAFLSNRSVVLLDEPTAHLDIETEYELKETMLDLFENRVVFFATHRLHWMLNMDVIIVLHQGEVVEMGKHKALLAKKGFYYELIKGQVEE